MLIKIFLFRLLDPQAWSVEWLDCPVRHEELRHGSYVSQQSSDDEEILRLCARRFAHQDSLGSHLEHSSFLPFGDVAHQTVLKH